MRQVGRLGQLEHDRPLTGLDGHRHQGLLAVRQGGLGPHPARVHRLFGPEYDDGLGGLQRLLGHLVVGFAGPQGRVPPDFESLGCEPLGEAARNGLILAVVGKEDVRHQPMISKSSSPTGRTKSPHLPLLRQ